MCSQTPRAEESLTGCRHSSHSIFRLVALFAARFIASESHLTRRCSERLPGLRSDFIMTMYFYSSRPRRRKPSLILFSLDGVSVFALRKSDYRSRLREACAAARTGAEICGLLVDCGRAASLVPVRNVARRNGGFRFSVRDVRRICAAADLLGCEVVGTYHSHPVGLATPGHSDLLSAVDDSFLLIFDCMDRKAQLWKISRGAANPSKFRLL